MLFAIDIDGTIATSGNWFARWITEQAGLAIPEADLARIRYGAEFWRHHLVCTLTHEQRVGLRAIAKAHHKDQDHQQNLVPIPGAREALQSILDEGGRLIYTTCR